MRVYKADSLWVMGVEGGRMEGLSQEPQAVLLQSYPVPVKLWQTPTEVRENPFHDEYLEVDYSFREFQSEEIRLFIFQVDHTRYKPGYATAKSEFFVTEEFVSEKVDSLRQRNSIAEYEWDQTKGIWNVVGEYAENDFYFENDNFADGLIQENESKGIIEKYKSFYLPKKNRKR